MATKTILTAYCMKTKTKNVPFAGKPEINKTSRGSYMVKGVDKAGNKMVTTVSEVVALAAVKEGVAKKVW